MAFDYVKFLAENKLTSTSRLNEKAKLLNENYIDLRPINSLKEEEEDVDDIEDVESSEEEFDFTSPGKKDEFDVDDDVEPTAKDVKAGDDLAKTAGGKQGRLTALIALKDKFLNQWKSGELTTDEYKDKTTNYTTSDGKKINIPMQIKQLQASIDQELSVSDDSEEEI